MMLFQLKVDSQMFKCSWVVHSLLLMTFFFFSVSCLIFFVIELSFSPLSLYLQAQFSQMRPVTMAPSVGPRMPMFPPGPGLGQQFLYGQGPPAIMPPQVDLLIYSFMVVLLNFCQY